jgi:hypothetical protein
MCLQAPVASSLITDLLAMSGPHGVRGRACKDRGSVSPAGGVLEASDALHLLGALLVRSVTVLSTAPASPHSHAKQVAAWLWQNCSFGSLQELEGLYELGAVSVQFSSKCIYCRSKGIPSG